MFAIRFLQRKSRVDPLQGRQMKERMYRLNRLLIPEGQIADFDLLTYREVEERFDTDYLIYFMMDGSVDFISEGESHHLEEKEFLFIDSCAHYSWKAQESILMARFCFSVEEISKYYEIHKLKISCNCETYGNTVAYQRLRDLLEKCISYYYGKKEADGRSLLCLNSLYYQIAEQLVEHFSVYLSPEDSEGGGSQEQRVNDIIRYINANFKHQISLNDLAERMYLSPTYVSRYIKKKLGKNLMEYLTDIRLESAVGELETTEKTIARIALDNGFANVSSFNKAFRERYGETPKQYQESILSGKRQAKSDENIAAGMDIKVRDYIANIHETPSQLEEIHMDFCADASQYHYLPKNWNRLINVGRVIMLLRGDVQEQLLFLKQRLGFTYVRIWDIYDEELSLNVNSADGQHNFSKLDKALDFLIKNQMRPYFELGFKPVFLHESFSTYIVYHDREVLFHDYLDYGRYLESMLIHFVNRYGMYEVSQWVFEQWCDPRFFSEESDLEYFRTFEMAWNAIKNIVPAVRVGGGFDREYGVIDFETLIRDWSGRNIQPDFIAIYCYHSRGAENEETASFWPQGAKANQNLDRRWLKDAQKPDFFKKYVKAHRDLMRSYGMQMPVYVSEYSLTPLNRNVLNDSCFKGAYLMKVMMDLYSETEMMGYWFGTDLITEGEEAPHLLQGCCGLLSYDGICKPAFYAFDFMNQLGNYLIKQSENVMASYDGYENYTLVCHNYKHVSSQYFAKDESEITIDSMQTLFPDTSRLKINVKLEHIKDGSYYIKTHSINSKHGSIQDEWHRMGFIEEPSTKDILYLDRISVPQVTVYEILVRNQTLEITLELEPQEIQYIEIHKITK